MIGCARAILMAAALGAGAAAPGFGETLEQLVYWPLVTDGKEYRRVAYPKEAGPLLVLAGTEVVLETRRAPVAYWPITREYLADFSRAAEPVTGSVEIVDAAGDVTVVAPATYLVWHPLGVGAGPAELVHGERTRPFYEGYIQTAREAARKVEEYQRIVGAHQAAVEAWLRLAAERRGENMPPPPPELDIAEPEPFHAYASEPQEAAVVALPEGTYTLRIRAPGGELVPGSERQLVSFAPRARAVGYVVRPEDRWTRPVTSFTPEEAIYTTGGADLFLQPVPVAAYEARRFTRLFRPQSREAVDPALTVWTPDAERAWAEDEVTLALWSGDALLDAVPRVPYRVAQLRGVPRGYRIEAFTPADGGALAPDFTAMRLDREAEVDRIGLVLGDGAPIAGSGREIRTVAPPAEAWLFLPALLPLAFGAALKVRRRRGHVPVPAWTAKLWPVGGSGWRLR
jgi:hypothetical protein